MEYGLNPELVKRYVALALEEDAPRGDITSELCVNQESRVNAVLVAKSPGVVAGTLFAKEAFEQCGATCEIRIPDGGKVKPGEMILRVVDSPARAVLRAERIALNFLGHLSGAATATAQLVASVEGTGTVILDTRKTTPGMRMAEKAAVRAGGAHNHRLSLSHGVLIKENHIRAAGGVRNAVERALAANLPDDMWLEVEVTDLIELREAIESGAKMVLLDNMDEETMREAVVIAHQSSVLTEASGNVTLSNVRRVADTGVDFISVGYITHSAPWLDLSLLVEHDRQRV